MQVTMDKVKTTAFVMNNRLLGYKLLQNPKGTNPNEVTMLRTWLGLPSGGIRGECVDKCYHYHKIHRHINDDKVVLDETFLMSEYFMDPETKTYPRKRKNHYGFIIKNGEYKPVDKIYVSSYEADKRPTPEWCSDNFDNPVEKEQFKSELFRQNKAHKYYLPRRMLLDRLLALFHLIGERPVEPSFWQVLKTNLNGGGIK